MQFVAVGEGQVGMGTDVGCGGTEGVLRRSAAGEAVEPPISAGVGDKEAGAQPANKVIRMRSAKRLR